MLSTGQVYVGATSESVGVAKRIRQHWTSRALDTTRIFALMTTEHFDEESSLLEQFPPKFALNRFIGGRSAERFVVNMRTRSHSGR